ncbi:MAG: carbamate kinase [Propionibacteriaceae bacterium]|nr:carbamate kinase [Propionibacteriaceae bacterium]
MRIVLALGGNALTGPKESVQPAHQIAAVEAATPQVAALVAEGHQVLLSHGNGPQVGNILAKNDIASPVLSPVPLDWCVANTQGSIGFILLNALDASLSRAGLSTRATVVVSRTVVAADDPAFAHFTKPVGRFVEPEIAQRLSLSGQHFVDSGEQGWRRVVASPQPLEIVEAPAIAALLDADFLVVAGGGGGIPVIRTDDHELKGVEAVIDKDLNSVLLAAQIDAEVLVLATNVDNAWLDWGKDTARALGTASVTEMRQHLAGGQFPPGSMGPKVEAICRFVETTGGKGIITNLDSITEAIAGRAGTVVMPDSTQG